MYILEGDAFRYGVNDRGQAATARNKLSGHEYILRPDDLWKLIYSEGDRAEIPLFARDQAFTCTRQGQTMVLFYDGLQGYGRALDVSLWLHFRMDHDALTVWAEIENRDDAEIMELSITAVSGARSLGGQPERDALAWPLRMGMRVQNPAFSDLSTYAGFRKYERHDHFHTDLDNLYPATMSMQWFDWYNEEEGLYVGSHDTTHHTLCMHVERDVKDNILRMGVIRYPMLQKGERYVGAPIVYAPHLGDWHAGARRYRAFMEASGNWAAPRSPDWARRFKGWLRVILKPQHGEINWTYDDIPRLYDEAEAAGMDTLYLMGWEKEGFARRWPDYEPDPLMGGEAKLREGIEYIHRKGGKVILFLSYSLIDRQSDYYLNGPGEEVTIKSIWGEEVPFSETYSGEGTYRKFPNPPMPMYLACAGADKWQDKMIESADLCLSLGADGVLYDLGGLKAHLCFDKRHNHKKPSHACEEKAARFKGLYDNIHGHDPERIILMEHSVDIFNQHMDIVHSSRSFGEKNDLPELYRYTFPELVQTNRERGMDEENHKADIGYTFIYGLRFDMTIFRGFGCLSDIPRYAAALAEANRLRDRYAGTLLMGRFMDTEGIAWDRAGVRAKAFAARDGEIAAALWNPTAKEARVTVTFSDGTAHTVTVPPEGIAAVSNREDLLPPR